MSQGEVRSGQEGRTVLYATDRSDGSQIRITDNCGIIEVAVSQWTEGGQNAKFASNNADERQELCIGSVAGAMDSHTLHAPQQPRRKVSGSVFTGCQCLTCQPGGSDEQTRVNISGSRDARHPRVNLDPGHTLYTATACPHRPPVNHPSRLRNLNRLEISRLGSYVADKETMHDGV
ncbi:hypothetical protein FIBSPDRAFT_987989 [Athelia psychrophila]|uniref:Uncharacterized protein n=1 Tax=Athelia psychrophila TaxID=1759441 RepID=A0A166ABM6_9AGAM|nr:hypothetical protein FIBSPDRAFT_987989 [Fibularhizoctonia sp. CBS 109695]